MQIDYRGVGLAQIFESFVFALFIGIDEDLFSRGFAFGVIERYGVWIAAMIGAGLKMAVLSEPLSTFTMTGSNLGQSEIADDERRRWGAEMGPLMMLLKRPVIVLHRIRKLLDGAYRPRDVTVEVYTPDSPDRRVTVSRQGVSFRWPGEVKVTGSSAGAE